MKEGMKEGRDLKVTLLLSEAELIIYQGSNH